MANIFQDPTKTLPQKTDDQIVRVNMEELEIGGRKSHLPANSKNEAAITHVPNAGTK